MQDLNCSSPARSVPTPWTSAAHKRSRRASKGDNARLGLCKQQLSKSIFDLAFIYCRLPHCCVTQCVLSAATGRGGGMFFLQGVTACYYFISKMNRAVVFLWRMRAVGWFELITLNFLGLLNIWVDNCSGMVKVTIWTKQDGIWLSPTGIRGVRRLIFYEILVFAGYLKNRCPVDFKMCHRPLQSIYQQNFKF